MAQKKAKKKSLIKSINPFMIFGKGRVFIFIFAVLGITVSIIGFQVVDSYRNRRLIKQYQEAQKTLTASEYQALLATPTIRDYIFPDDPTNFRVTYQPWRASLSAQERFEALDQLWIDPKDLEFSQLPDRSRQNIRDYIAELRSNDPNF